MPSSDEALLDRAQGCLLGQLAGDSLGSLVEFSSTDYLRWKHPDGVRDLCDGGVWGLLAGQPTDDSELALLLARTLVRLGRFDAGAILDTYCQHWPHFWDKGGTLNRALSAACRGHSTEERLRLAAEHANPESQSNGSLMRISPLGIFGAGRPSQAADWALLDSQLTHPHPVCCDSCAVYVVALAAAIGEGFSPQKTYEAALAETRRRGIDAEVLGALERARSAPPEGYDGDLQGWALIALQNAFWQLLHAPNPEEGVVDTVMRGGDTDTTAAIAGALLGAVHGRAALPARWVEVLLHCRPGPGTKTAHPRSEEFWPCDAPELAEQLLAAGKQGE
jgi:ADP-ribosylglycohydrolase